jgi:drug/metabolite transporter (DMT)-like permease
MPTRAPASPRSIAAGLLVLYLVWGSTYLAIAVAVDTIPPFVMAGARFFLAGALLAGWIAVRQGPDRLRLSRREWRDSAIVGALLLGGGMGMVAWGEQTVPSGITALVVSLMPVWVALIGGIALGERLPRMAVVGIILGFIGVAILVGPTALGETGALDPAGLIVILIAPIAWSIGSLFSSHRATLPRDPLTGTAAQMLTGGLILFGMALVTGEPARLDLGAVSGPSFLAFLYLLVIGSLLAFTVFGWMLRVAPLPLVTTYAYVNPVVAVILGFLILREPLDPRTVLAGVVIVAGVALIVTARGRMRAPRGVAATTATPSAPSVPVASVVPPPPGTPDPVAAPGSALSEGRPPS